MGYPIVGYYRTSDAFSTGGGVSSLSSGGYRIFFPYIRRYTMLPGETKQYGDYYTVLLLRNEKGNAIYSKAREDRYRTTVDKASPYAVVNMLELKRYQICIWAADKETSQVLSKVISWQITTKGKIANSEISTVGMPPSILEIEGAEGISTSSTGIPINDTSEPYGDVANEVFAQDTSTEGFDQIGDPSTTPYIAGDIMPIEPGAGLYSGIDYNASPPQDVSSIGSTGQTPQGGGGLGKAIAAILVALAIGR